MDKLIEQGVIVFLKANVDSKSEGLLPFLYRGREQPLMPLYLVNDNPFENQGLVPYDGLRVEVTGVFGRDDVFAVDEIKVI